MKKIFIFILLFYFSLQQISSFKYSNTVTQSNNISKHENYTKINNTSKTEQFEYSSNINQSNLENENETKIENENNNKTKEHYDDCNNDSECRIGLKCKTYRCLTIYEIDNLENLNLNVKNSCNNEKKCPNGKQCIKHRCVEKESKIDIREKKSDNDATVNLLFAGSIFLNNKSYISGDKGDGTFNFDHFFTHIKNDIGKADLAVVEQETIFQTNKTNFQKRVGNTPTELGDAIAKAGFKVVLHGSIYSYSKEEQGIINTLNFWKEKHPDIHTLGISKTKLDIENDYYVFVKNGIKIGIINFSGFQNLIPEDKEYMVNVIDEEKIENYVDKLQNETDFIIACVNWGDKNGVKPNKNQIYWAKDLVSKGVNLIIGNHPSYVQPVSYIKSKGKSALVFWSLGHLISDNQKKLTILGALANISISKGINGKTFISDYSLTPIINHKMNTTDYSIYKLSEYTEELGLKTDEKFSLKNITQECNKIMGPFVK